MNRAFTQLRSMFHHVLLAAFLCLSAALTGCRTPPPMEPMDLSAPGWKVRQGQAVWRPANAGTEIAGELLAAAHPNGRAMAQFSKPPVPLVTARLEQARWHIRFSPQNRNLSGEGKPPDQFVWFQLLAAMRGETLPSGWVFEASDGESWRLENSTTGERLEGFWFP